MQLEVNAYPTQFRLLCHALHGVAGTKQEHVYADGGISNVKHRSKSSFVFSLPACGTHIASGIGGVAVREVTLITKKEIADATHSETVYKPVLRSINPVLGGTAIDSLKDHKTDARRLLAHNDAA